MAGGITAFAQDARPGHPQGTSFETTLEYTSNGDIKVHYTLSNYGNTTFVAKPADLFIYYGTTSLPYQLVHSPAPRLAHRLSKDESETGTVLITNPPYDSDHLQLVWQLYEMGPDRYHTLLRTFGEIEQKEGR